MESSMFDESIMLSRLRQRDPQVFHPYFETYADKVYRLAIGLLKQEEDAEEVVQATFLSAFEAIDRFEAQARVSTWLYWIAYNHALMLLRRRHQIDPLPDEDESLPLPVALVDWSHLPEDQALGEEARDAACGHQRTPTGAACGLHPAGHRRRIDGRVRSCAGTDGSSL
jgi:RNA polymerase sigma-70 factor, ECF subfamily